MCTLLFTRQKKDKNKIINIYIFGACPNRVGHTHHHMINGKEIAASLLELWLFLASCIFMIQCYDVIIDRAKMLNTSEEKKTNKKEYRQSALDFHLTHTEQTARRSSQEAFRRFFLNNTKLYAIFRLLRFIFFLGTSYHGVLRLLCTLFVIQFISMCHIIIESCFIFGMFTCYDFSVLPLFRSTF